MFPRNKSILLSTYVRSLCKRNWLNNASTAIGSLPWAPKRSSSGAVGDLTVQSRRHHFFSTACLSVRRATVRSLYILKVRDVAWHSTMFFVIQSQRWRCRSVVGGLKETLLQVPLRFALFKDAAGSLWRHNPGVTGFFIYSIYVWLSCMLIQYFLSDNKNLYTRVSLACCPYKKIIKS